MAERRYEKSVAENLSPEIEADTEATRNGKIVGYSAWLFGWFVFFTFVVTPVLRTNTGILGGGIGKGIAHGFHTMFFLGSFLWVRSRLSPGKVKSLSLWKSATVIGAVALILFRVIAVPKGYMAGAAHYNDTISGGAAKKGAAVGRNATSRARDWIHVAGSVSDGDGVTQYIDRNSMVADGYRITVDYLWNERKANSEGVRSTSAEISADCNTRIAIYRSIKSYEGHMGEGRVITQKDEPMQVSIADSAGDTLCVLN